MTMISMVLCLVYSRFDLTQNFDPGMNAVKIIEVCVFDAGIVFLRHVVSRERFQIFAQDQSPHLKKNTSK